MTILKDLNPIYKHEQLLIRREREREREKKKVEWREESLLRKSDFTFYFQRRFPLPNTVELVQRKPISYAQLPIYIKCHSGHSSKPSPRSALIKRTETLKKSSKKRELFPSLSQNCRPQTEKKRIQLEAVAFLVNSTSISNQRQRKKIGELLYSILLNEKNSPKICCFL